MKYMKYFDIINKHKYIYLGELVEPEDNCLAFKIQEASVSENEETLDISGTEIRGFSAIEVTENSNIYQVVFPSYIAYSIRDESFALPDDYEAFEGRLVCIYSKSHSLDYISKSTFASEDHPGPYLNYGFNCLNHIIDAVSSEAPSI